MKYGNIREEELKMHPPPPPPDTTLMPRDPTACPLHTLFTIKVLVMTIYAGSGMHTRHGCTRYF